MSLDFYCRWSSTVAYKEIFKNYLKYWGSIVGGVPSLEFYGRHTMYVYRIKTNKIYKNWGKTNGSFTVSDNDKYKEGKSAYTIIW